MVSTWYSSTQRVSLAALFLMELVQSWNVLSTSKAPQ